MGTGIGPYLSESGLHFLQEQAVGRFLPEVVHQLYGFLRTAVAFLPALQQ
jgi:hypothetical protein